MASIFGKSESDICLENRTFATIRAIKGKQFGRDVYTSVIRFQDLANFLEIFPTVQRDIIPRKVGSLRRYIMSGLEKNGTVSMRFFSAVTVTCRGNIYYNDDIARASIDTYNSKLSINDGQHRFEAIRTTLEQLEAEFVKSKNKERTGKVKAWIDELREMVIPIVIFDGLSEIEEKQLFHDLNNLAQRPSRNSNIRLDQSDLFSRMARDVSKYNRYLSYYGVETDKMSIFNSNPNTILLSTIYESIKELLSDKHKYNKVYLVEDNYNEVKDQINDTFTRMFQQFPVDINVKGKYLIDKSYTIKAIARFICHARSNSELMLDDDVIFKIIKDIDWSLNIDTWSKYGGIQGSKGSIVFGVGGFRAVYSALMDKAIEVTTDK